MHESLSNTLHPSVAALEADMPPAIKRLPLDRRGFPVPWFVAWINGEPDFRIIDSGMPVKALKERRCWICGTKLSAYASYVIGPMCAVNRASAEPPSHGICARWAAKACPFLARPRARRRDAGMPMDRSKSVTPGIMLDRNPGVTLVWTIKGPPQTFRVPNGILFDVGTPVSWEAWAEGRAATEEELVESIVSGLPLLYEAAEQDRRPEEAVAALGKSLQRAEQLLGVELAAA